MRCSLLSALPTLPTLLALLLGSSGCGSGPSGGLPDAGSPFAGRWHGVLKQALIGADLHVNVDAQQAVEGSNIYEGDLSTDSAHCFTSGMLTATDSNGSLMMNALGSGSATQQCGITITGQLGVGQIVGLISMVSTLGDDCNIDATAFTLTRE